MDNMHKTISKPWGSEKILAEGPTFKIKIIAIKPGQMISYQRHDRKIEAMKLLKGWCGLIFGESFRKLEVREIVVISPGLPHRLMNMGLSDVEVLEMSTGEDNDIVRLSDMYGRL